MDGGDATEGKAPGFSPAAFSRDMALAARAEARLLACAGAMERQEAQACLAFVMGVEAALLLLRAAAEGEMAAADAAREARRLPLRLDPVRIARLPQPARLEMVALTLCADGLAAELAALPEEMERQNEKPRRRQGRPRLHVVAGSP